MRRNTTILLKDLLNEYVKATKIDTRMQQEQLIAAWPAVMGKAVERYTQSLYIKNRVLYVRLNSSILRNELLLMRLKICDNLNAQVGASLIDNIVFC